MGNSSPGINGQAVASSNQGPFLRSQRTGVNPPKISIEVVSLEKTSTFREAKKPKDALRESSNSPLSRSAASNHNDDALSANSIRASPRYGKEDIPAMRGNDRY